MSEVRLNIIDTNDAIHCTTHGAVADAVVASLSAEPETIAELEAALQRFIKPVDDHRPFDLFRAGTNLEPWDAGILVVDLAARVVAAESSYSGPQAQGEIRYHDGAQATDVALLYRVPDDWLFVYSMDEYEVARDKRRAERAAAPPLDARPILYGAPMIDFIVAETRNPPCEDLQYSSSLGVFAGLGGFAQNASDPQSAMRNPQSVHTRWLMTPRADLRGQTPREAMLARQDFIDFDLQTRELQWSLLGEGPPPLARDSFGYRFAGFGTHECVLYYDLLRHLLSEVWQRTDSGCLSHSESSAPFEGLAQSEIVAPSESSAQSESFAPAGSSAQSESFAPAGGSAQSESLAPSGTSAQSESFAASGSSAQSESSFASGAAAESARLNEVKEAWLNTPQREFEGRIPIAMIESERRRIPLVMSAKQMMIDENCEVCRLVAGETGADFGSGFWHLDGSNMDEGFEFSLCRTREEWEESERRRREFDEEFKRKWAQEHGDYATKN